MTLEGIHRDEAMREIVSLGLIEARGCDPKLAEDLGFEIERQVGSLRDTLAGKSPSEIEQLAAARALYRSLGIDPTRHRPSPEALLRRVLKGQDFPRIHPAVDLANLWGLSSGLPVGLYDLDKVVGTDIVVRVGQENETYEGIRRGTIHLDGRLVLVDADGPFGNPTADSQRTSVSKTSSSCLFVMFAPVTYDVSALDRWVAWLRERANAYFGAEVVSAVLP